MIIHDRAQDAGLAKTWLINESVLGNSIKQSCYKTSAFSVWSGVF